jgi:hypothetical protein
MNSILRNVAMLIAMTTVVSVKANAQVVAKTVSIQPGYTNQTFYNMSSGVVSSVINTDWDLAFQLRGFNASIMINSKNNVRLFKANKDLSQWSSMVAYDTTGIVSDPAYELFNSDTSWNYGAASRTNDTTNQFDLGWGVYDFVTHNVVGDSIFFLKLSSGAYKKFMIENLAGGIYNFKWADLDGTNETSGQINKTNYTNKAFAYYSIVNNIAIDREPIFNSWDLVFQQYLSLTPYNYKVTGTLMNDSVYAAKVYPVDPLMASPIGVTMNKEINTVSYDWKAFDFNTNVWTIADSTVYFVQDRAGSMWQIVFTGFGGSANGDFYFDQSPVQATGIIENTKLQTFGIYPNPANAIARLVVSAANTSPAVLNIFDLNGRLVATQNIQLSTGVQTIDLPVSDLQSGLYQLSIQQGDSIQTSKLVKQ